MLRIIYVDREKKRRMMKGNGTTDGSKDVEPEGRM